MSDLGLLPQLCRLRYRERDALVEEWVLDLSSSRDCGEPTRQYTQRLFVEGGKRLDGVSEHEIVMATEYYCGVGMDGLDEK